MRVSVRPAVRVGRQSEPVAAAHTEETTVSECHFGLRPITPKSPFGLLALLSFLDHPGFHLCSFVGQPHQRPEQQWLGRFVQRILIRLRPVEWR